MSALTADGPKVKVGDVIEVQYRHFSADGRMVEPVNPKLRTDKDASECREDQFVRVNTHKIGAE